MMTMTMTSEQRAGLIIFNSHSCLSLVSRWKRGERRVGMRKNSLIQLLYGIRGKRLASLLDCLVCGLFEREGDSLDLTLQWSGFLKKGWGTDRRINYQFQPATSPHLSTERLGDETAPPPLDGLEHGA
jgi:hypothetical protein